MRKILLAPVRRPYAAARGGGRVQRGCALRRRRRAGRFSLKAKAVVPALIGRLRDPETEVAAAAANGLTRMGSLAERLAAPAGYSGEPFDIVVGLSLDGRVAGTALLEHYEPMIGPELIPEAAMQRYLDNLTDLRVDQPIREGARGVDGVSGATISSTLMAGAVLLAGRKVARRTGVAGDGAEGALRLDAERFEERD